MKEFIKGIKNIIWLCKPYWKYGKMYILFSILFLVFPPAINDVIYVRFPDIIINLLAREESFSYISIIATIICCVSLLNRIIPNLFYSYFSKKNTDIGLKINRDIYEKALSIDYKYIDNPKFYDNYSWVINEYGKQVNSTREFIISFSKYLLSVVILISIIASIGPWILLIEVIQMIIHTIINIKVNKNEIEKKEKVVPIERRLNYYHRIFYEKEYATDLKSTLLSKFIFNEYDKIGKDKVKTITNFARKSAFWGNVHEVIFNVVELIIILYLVQSIISGKIPQIAMYITMILAFYKLDSKLYSFIAILQKANDLSNNADKIHLFFDIKSDIEIDNNLKEMFPSKNQFFSIEFRNVNFKYENSDFSLSNISFNVKQGEKVAIVGENGVGKTTIVKLVLRLYDVNSGEILINGVNINKYNITDLRQKIGVAFQNSNIYAFSVKDNISLYKDKSKIELDKLDNNLGFGNLLKKHNANYDSELTKEFDESGVILSGGEIQKIALARLLDGDFGLVLLDEPSSALDPIAEYKMSEMMLNVANEATIIMISHRLSTTRKADKIILIDHGRIKEIGTHDELMRLHGKYYEMFTKQAENYI